MIFVATNKDRTTNFFTLLFLFLVLGSGIRDPRSGIGMDKKIGIRDRHLGSATLLYPEPEGLTWSGHVLKSEWLVLFRGRGRYITDRDKLLRLFFQIKL
jgi:hypothetical protein